MVELLEKANEISQNKKPENKSGRPDKEDMSLKFAIFMYYLSRSGGMMDWADHFGVPEVIQFY